MSLNAPWLALACDWHDSDMFVGTTAAQKLCWIALLCFTKSKGRAGRLTIHPAAVCRDFGLERADLDEMLRRAVKDGSIEIDQNDVTTVRFINWAKYQDPSQRRTSLVKGHDFTKKPATKDQGPRTKHQSVSADDVSVVLDRIGFAAQYRADLPADLTPDTVLRLFVQLSSNGKVKAPLAVLNTALRNGEQPSKPLTPKQVAKAINDGLIQTIDGIPHGPPAGYNSNGVTVADKIILKPRDIAKVVFE